MKITLSCKEINAIILRIFRYYHTCKHTGSLSKQETKIPMAYFNAAYVTKLRLI